jgi:hypothetical protein
MFLTALEKNQGVRNKIYFYKTLLLNNFEKATRIESIFITPRRKPH